jgi:SAM-dependent methyltransferase
VRATADAPAALVTGAQYERQITRCASDRAARAAFQQLARQLAPPGARVLDFGCGTGLDARAYAQFGFTVAAYDVDVNMRDYFAACCREPLAAGRVTLEAGTYAQFLAQPVAQAARVQLITTNFAPLNLIAELAPLFATFHARCAPGARVLASVLCPYYLGDLRYLWWWRNLPLLLSRGRYAVAGAQASIVRRRPEQFAAQAAPYFMLERVYRGLPARQGQAADAPSPARTWLQLTTCRFMFLQFVRRESPHAAARGLPDR